MIFYYKNIYPKNYDFINIDNSYVSQKNFKPVYFLHEKSQ